MKNRFATWLKELPEATTFAIEDSCAVVLAGEHRLALRVQTKKWSGKHLICALDVDNHVLTVHRVYKSGRKRLLGEFTESTFEKNFLLDPTYGGNAVLATSYDPCGMYKAGVNVPYFVYSRGPEYGECGKAIFNQESGIMTIICERDIISWVGENGVIAAVCPKGKTIKVAFYDRISRW